MPTTARVPQNTYPLAPAGTHVARVYRFMNLGTRFQEYQGVMKDYPDTLVTFTLELPNELNKFTVKNEDGTEEEIEKPFVISREFTLSMGKKSNLRPFIEGIIGTTLTDEEAGNFDIETVVGMTCQATIVHKQSKSDPDRKYANLVSVAPLMKGIEAPAQINETQIQDVKTMTEEEIEKLPEFLRKKIKDSDEWKERFDPATQNKREEIREELEKRGVVQPKQSEEINPEEIPF